MIPMFECKLSRIHEGASPETFMNSLGFTILGLLFSTWINLANRVAHQSSTICANRLPNVRLQAGLLVGPANKGTARKTARRWRVPLRLGCWITLLGYRHKVTAMFRRESLVEKLETSSTWNLNLKALLIEPLIYSKRRSWLCRISIAWNSYPRISLNSTVLLEEIGTMRNLNNRICTEKSSKFDIVCYSLI